MEIERSRFIQADHLGNCRRSLGSNQQPCSQSWKQLGSQSRKMSIGIVVESSLKPNSTQTVVDKVVVSSLEKKTTLGENREEQKNERQEVQSCGNGNRCDADRQDSSPWITSRSLNIYAQTGESPDIAKRTSNTPILGTYDQNARCSGQFVRNQKVSAYADGREKENDGTSCRKNGENNMSNRKFDKVPYTAAAKGYFGELGVLQDRTNLAENTSREILRMNLWEALGTKPSPTKQLPSPQKPETGFDDMNKDRNKFEGPSNFRQGSETTEPDSESPIPPITRAVTRSLTTKRVSNKLHSQNVAKKQVRPTVADSKKLRRNQYPADKVKQLENAFFLDQELFASNPNAIPTTSTSVLKHDKKRGGIKSANILPPDKHAPVARLLAENVSRRLPAKSKEASVTGKQTKDFSGSSKLKDKGPLPPDDAEVQNEFSCPSPQRNGLQCDNIRRPILKTKPSAQAPLFGPLPQVNTMEQQHHQPSRGKSDSIVGDTFASGSKLPGSNNTSVLGMQRKNTQSSLKMKYQHKGTEVSPSPDNAKIQSHPHVQPLYDKAGPLNDFSSPCLKMKTVVSSPSHSASPQFNEDEHQGNGNTPVEAEAFVSKLRSRLTRSPGISGSDTAKSSDNTSEMKDSPTSTPELSLEGKDEEGDRYTSKRRKLDSIFRNAFVSKASFTEDFDTFLEIRPIEKPSRRSKQLRLHQDKDHSDVSPSLDSPKVHVETDNIVEASQQTQENGLARVVTLFGLSLEKVKSKMNLAVRRRCSDILVSAAEDIQQRLQIVESQIQNDIGKLTSQSKSKRKCLETRFQGLQEQLNSMHEKFKDEIDRHLQDCRSSVEELEVAQTELRGAIERQKASHRKLLLQVEEAVQNELIDTQNRITTVHESGRGKMLQLKLALAECFKDGIFTS